MVLIAQFTDLHIGAEDDPLTAGNFARFAECLETAKGFLRKPDFLLVTGDVTERGDAASYARFIAAMRAAGLPWGCTLGNHDSPEAFDAAAAAQDCGLLDRSDAIPLGKWRIVLADTSGDGLHGGYFDAARAERLDAVLSQEPEAPTLLAMHHPPVPIGLDWIDPQPDEAWIGLLADVVRRHPQIRRVLCGHVHLPVMTAFAGVPLATAPATAAQGWPELAPFDNGAPDGRPLMVAGPPGFALHLAERGGLSTLFCTSRPGESMLRHDREPGQQPA